MWVVNLDQIKVRVASKSALTDSEHGFQVSGVRAAAGLKNGQSNRERNFGLAGSQTSIKNE